MNDAGNSFAQGGPNGRRHARSSHRRAEGYQHAQRREENLAGGYQRLWLAGHKRPPEGQISKVAARGRRFANFSRSSKARARIAG